LEGGCENLAIKEMSLEEKYDRIFDFFTLTHAICYASHKQLGTIDKWLDITVEAFGKIQPRFMEPVVKLMTTPGMTIEQIFKEALKHTLYAEQQMHPLSEIEFNFVSDRELVVKFNNCERLRRAKKVVKEAGLNFNPLELCEMEKRIHLHPRHPMRQMGLDVTAELGETGCKWTFRLK
jgi:hypothetical protein